MPWKETDAVDQRLRFVADYLRQEWSFAELCRRYGVSRPTGYKWVSRYVEEGPAGLRDRKRAPVRHPNATAAPLVELVLEARKAHPTWGPRKLLPWLARRYPGLKLPAASTVGTILRRHGLTARRRRARAGSPASHLGRQDVPNASWSIDFKGQFRVGGALCYPLTLLDGCSRFLVRCQGLPHPRTAYVQPVMEAAFREFGLPDAIRSDNGAPFASRGFTGLTKLSAWWLRLGIRLDRTRPGSPQDNGRLERLHRTLKADACRPPRANMEQQQVAFATFRREYNHERPHEALDMDTPACRYEPSARPYPSRPPKPEYPPDAQVRRVHPNGQTCFAGWLLPVGAALAGDRVAFVPIDEGVYECRYYSHRLATLSATRGVASNGACSRTCDPSPSRRRSHGR